MSFILDNMLGILVACIVLLVYILIKRRLEYFSSKGFPFVKPTFLSFIKSLSVNSMNFRPMELYVQEQDKGNQCVGFFHTLLVPSVLVLDPTLAESILIKDFSHFQDHGIDLDTKRDPLVGHLFNMKGDEWRALRNKLLPTFTSGKLKGMVPGMDMCAQKLMDEMKQDAKLRKDVNLKDLYRNYTLSVIASCVFAIDPESIKSPDCEFRQALNKIIKPSLRSIVFMFLIMSFPKLVKMMKLKFVPQDLEDFFIKLTKDALDHRKKSGVKRNDFVQLLLELKEKGTVEVDVRDLEEDEKKDVQQAANSETHSNKLEMTDELLSAQAFVFIVAGFDNTSYLAGITMYVLSKHKDIQKRVRQEVREAIDKHGGMNYMALKDMKLLHASIDEALRLYPPLLMLLRVCNKTYTLSNGVTIEKGMSVMIPSKALQTDSKYWPNPDKFDPDRFLDSNITPGTYLPFGDGPRLCIAQRLALLMAKVILAKVIVNYELQPSSKTKEPLTPKMFFSADVTGGLWGSFEPLQE